MAVRFQFCQMRKFRTSAEILSAWSCYGFVHVNVRGGSHVRGSYCKDKGTQGNVGRCGASLIREGGDGIRAFASVWMHQSVHINARSALRIDYTIKRTQTAEPHSPTSP